MGGGGGTRTFSGTAAEQNFSHLSPRGGMDCGSRMSESCRNSVVSARYDEEEEGAAASVFMLSSSLRWELKENLRASIAGVLEGEEQRGVTGRIISRGYTWTCAESSSKELEKGSEVEGAGGGEAGKGKGGWRGGREREKLRVAVLKATRFVRREGERRKEEGRTVRETAQMRDDDLFIVACRNGALTEVGAWRNTHRRCCCWSSETTVVERESLLTVADMTSE